MLQCTENKLAIMKRILVYGVLAFIVPIMLFLTYYSFRYSIGAMDIPFDTIMVETKDSIWIHFVVLAVLLMILPILKRLSVIKEVKESWISFYIYGIMIIAFAFCLLWVLNGNFYAQNDSRGVLNCLMQIRNGEYYVLKPEEYIGAHKHHLGLLTLFNTIFNVTGSTDEIVIQIVNAFCVPVIIYAGYRILKEMSVETFVFVFYGLFALCCFPVFFYTPYVYGEILSVTAGMLFVWAAFCYLKRGNAGSWIALIVCSIVGNMARGNFPIVMIAFAIIAVLYGARRKALKPCLCAVSLFVAIMLANTLNVKYYESISGIKIDQGIPIEGFLAMGLNEDRELSYGMHTGYHLQTYAESGYNSEVAKIEYRKLIKDRITMFANGAGTDPLTFYKVKLLLQWNDPTFNCFMENETFIPEPHPVIKEIVYVEGKYADIVREFLNQYHLFLYMGVLFYCLSLFKSKTPFYNVLIPVILIGGFLFTMIWEAMSRYVLPYAVYMMPIASIGWFWVSNSMCHIFAKGRSAFGQKSDK